MGAAGPLSVQRRRGRLRRAARCCGRRDADDLVRRGEVGARAVGLALTRHKDTPPASRWRRVFVLFGGIILILAWRLPTYGIVKSLRLMLADARHPSRGQRSCR